MRKDEYTLTKELRRLAKYGLLLQAKRISYSETEGYKYNILFTDDKRILEPDCSVSEVMGIINSLDICLELQKANNKGQEIDDSEDAEKVLTQAGKELFEELRILRYQYAREETMPAYIIFRDKTLIDMCIKLPSDRQEMLDVFGMSEGKYEKYGEAFLRKISEFVKDNSEVVTSEITGFMA